MYGVQSLQEKFFLKNNVPKMQVLSIRMPFHKNQFTAPRISKYAKFQAYEICIKVTHLRATMYLRNKWSMRKKVLRL